MADYIAVYDLQDMNPSPYGEFIAQAEQRGWQRWIWGPKNKKWLKLPNTTLIGEFENGEAAKAAFDQSVAATTKSLGRQVIVEKYLIAVYHSAQYNSDEKIDP